MDESSEQPLGMGSHVPPEVFLAIAGEFCARERLRLHAPSHPAMPSNNDDIVARAEMRGLNPDQIRLASQLGQRSFEQTIRREIN